MSSIVFGLRDLRGGVSSVFSLTRRGMARILPTLPAVAVVLLPKCPLCVMAWLGIFGSLELSPWVSRLWGMPLSLLLLGLVMVLLVLRARRSGDWRAVMAGLLGATALFTGRFIYEVPGLLYGGLAVLSLATLWSGQLLARATRRGSPCGSSQTMPCVCQRPQVGNTST